MESTASRSWQRTGLVAGALAPLLMPFLMAGLGAASYAMVGAQGWPFVAATLMFLGGIAVNIYVLHKAEDFWKPWVIGVVGILDTAAWLAALPVSYVVFFLFATNGG